jgi:hypothetical protein
VERSKDSISPNALYAQLGSEAAPIIVMYGEGTGDVQIAW